MILSRSFWREHRAIGLLLSVSWLLRLGLAARGGQLYWPDEFWFSRSVQLFSLLRTGDFGQAANLMVQQSIHPGFVPIGSLAVPFAWIATKLLRLPVTRPVAPDGYWCSGCQTLIAVSDSSLWVAAAVLSLASVACIGFVYAIARKAGAGQTEALAAALLMACANTMFYYSRHLLAYDSTMALALLALLLGLEKHLGGWRAMASGAVLGLAFLNYNGYWAMVLGVMVVVLLYGRPPARQVVARAAGLAAGLAALPLALTLVSLAQGVRPFILGLAGFGQAQVVGGDPAESWWLTIEYLWHAEHGLLLVWLFAVGLVIWLWAKGDPAARSRGIWWLALAVTVHGVWVIASSGLNLFSNTGRGVRQFVPALCLLAASALPWLAAQRRFQGKLLTLAAAGLAIQAVFNFWTPFVQQWPLEVYRSVTATYGEVARDATVEGARLGYLSALDSITQPPVEQPPRPPWPRYILLNVDYLSKATSPKAPPPGAPVFRAAHPLQFLPYQYEGYRPAERVVLRTADIAMRLIDTTAAAQ